MAVTFTELDEALRAHFEGLSVTILDGALEAVPVFIEFPDGDAHKNRVYPSISISLQIVEEDVTGRDSNEDEVEILLVPGSGPGDPDTATVQDDSTWYQMVYHLNSWIRRDAQADRDVLTHIRQKARRRGTLTVGTDIFHMFAHFIATANEIDGDESIYRRIWRLEILADMLDNSSTHEERKVQEIHLHSHTIATGLVPLFTDLGNAGVSGVPRSDQRLGLRPLDENGDPVDSAEDAEATLHRVIVYDTDTFFILTEG